MNNATPDLNNLLVSVLAKALKPETEKQPAIPVAKTPDDRFARSLPHPDFMGITPWLMTRALLGYFAGLAAKTLAGWHLWYWFGGLLGLVVLAIAVNLLRCLWLSEKHQLIIGTETFVFVALFVALLNL